MVGVNNDLPDRCIKEITMRIGVAMMSHETNTFSPVITDLARFSHGDGMPVAGDKALEIFRDTASCMGGFIAVAEQAGATADAIVNVDDGGSDAVVAALEGRRRGVVHLPGDLASPANPLAQRCHGVGNAGILDVAFACGSVSTTKTRALRAATYEARLITVVVFPTPPFWFANA